MNEVIKFLQGFIPQHAPWLAYFAVSMVVSEVLERVLVQKRNEPIWLIWPRRLQSLLPLAIGAAVGLIWKEPEPGVKSTIAGCFYFASAGFASLFGYDIIVELLKRRGITISLPGTATVFPAAAEEDKTHVKLPPPPKVPTLPKDEE